MLEEKTVVRVGGNREIHTDVRVLAATNQKLAELVRAKRFREDLYFRLNVVSLELPPLRDRGDDILLLAEHFLHQFCRQAGRRTPKFTAAARKRLDQPHLARQRPRAAKSDGAAGVPVVRRDGSRPRTWRSFCRRRPAAPSIVDAGLESQRRHRPIPDRTTSASRSSGPAATSARRRRTSASTARICTARCGSSAWRPTSQASD